MFFRLLLVKSIGGKQFLALDVFPNGIEIFSRHSGFAGIANFAAKFSDFRRRFLQSQERLGIVALGPIL
jgi:hypothetical protein